MSRRLTEQDKAILSEYPSQISNAVKHIIDPTETKDFHEGMAAGILLMVELIDKTNNPKVIAESANALIQESIKHTR